MLLVIFGLAAENFFTLTTFRTIANQIPDTTIAAVGMTFVLIIAGIDLSVGSVLALSGAVLGIALVNWGLPLASGGPRLPAGRPGVRGGQRPGHHPLAAALRSLSRSACSKPPAAPPTW